MTPILVEAGTNQAHIEKWCTKGLHMKPLTDFYKDRQKKDGYTSSCKGCLDPGIAAYKKTPKGQEVRRKAVRNHRWRKQHGVENASEVFEELMIAQNGVCAICGQPETQTVRKTGHPRPLSIDHDHATGKIRGLLCAHCNNVLGQAQDDIEVLKSAIVYLEESRSSF